MIRKYAFLFFLILFPISNAKSQTLEEILKKYYEARGGLENIRSVQTVRFEGKMSMMGKDFPMVIYQKRSGQYRSEMKMGKSSIVQVFDGKIGWQIIPMTGSPDPIDMKEDELKSMKKQADIDGYLVDWKEKKYKLELIGRENLDSISVYHIKAILADSSEQHVYLDAKTYLETRLVGKEKIQGKEVQVTVSVGDYRKTGKLMMPFLQQVAGPMPQNIQYDKITFDNPISDSLFIKPKTK